MPKPGPGIAGKGMSAEEEKEAGGRQERDIAKRASQHAAMSSSPVDTGEDLPAAFTQHVQARMGAQGTKEASKVGFEKSDSGERIKGSYKKGGTIPETGTYKLHKGEKVTPAKSHHPHLSIHFHTKRV
jgi:hypothetical protein